MSRELKRRGIEVVWIGRRGGMEQNLAEREGIKFFPIPASGLVGKNLLARIGFLYRLIVGTILCIRIFIKERPDSILGAGGYSQIAPLIIARLFQRPIFLLEQNRIPGRVTRYFSRFAREIYGGFPIKGRLRSFYYTGNPLRREVVEVKKQGNAVLILGGSQGSKRLNYEALRLASRFPKLKFILLTGRRDYKEIERLNKYPNLSLVEFTLNPGELYSSSKLVVSRAGGLAISELLCLGLPSILIPFPYAADNHQLENARWTTERGASILLEEKEIDKLGMIISQLWKDRLRLKSLSERAKSLAKPRASEEIVERIVRCLQR